MTTPIICYEKGLFIWRKAHIMFCSWCIPGNKHTYIIAMHQNSFSIDAFLYNPLNDHILTYHTRDIKVCILCCNIFFLNVNCVYICNKRRLLHILVLGLYNKCFRQSKRAGGEHMTRVSSSTRNVADVCSSSRRQDTQATHHWPAPWHS